MKRILFVFVFLVLAVSIANAQNSIVEEDNTVTFNLKYKGGHYYINSDINGVPASIMLESGIPGLLIDRKFYEKHKDELRLNLKEADIKLRSITETRDIKLTGRGVVRIGDITYKGRMYVVEKLGKIMLPIQYLRNEKTGSAIVRLDLKASKMSLLSRSRLAQDTIGCNSFLLHKTERSLLPAIYTHLTLFTQYKTVQMDGNFVVDLGNAGLLYLFNNNDTVVKMIDDNGLKLYPAKDKSGKVVSKGVIADQCAIAGYTFRNATIGVTDKLKDDNSIAGMIGMKFFETPVIFDFGKKKFYIKPNK